MGAEKKVPIICGRKNCTRCTRWKLLIEFHVRRRDEDGNPTNWQTNCKTCQREISRYRKGIKMRGEPYGPRREKMSDEEFRARRREIHNERKKDPAYVEERREYARIYAEIRRREAGIPPRNFTSRKTPGTQTNVPVGPLKRWADKKLANGYRGSVKEFAISCGITTRELHRILTEEYPNVTEDFVDRILVEEGSTDLWELYPHLYEV